MEKKSNKILIFGVLVIIIIIVILAVLILKLKPKEEENSNNIAINNNISNNVDINNTNIEEPTIVGFTTIADRKDFFKIIDIIDNYCWYIQCINGEMQSDEEPTETIVKEELQNFQKIISTDYITEMKIKEDLIKEKYNSYKIGDKYEQGEIYSYSYLINNAYIINLSDDKQVIMVDFKVNSINDKILIKLDNSNNTYSIYLKDYIEKNQITEKSSKEQLKISDVKINNNGINELLNRNITDEAMSREYFKIFKNMVENYNEEMYSKLSSRCKENRFASYEGFKKYLDTNLKDRIGLCLMTKYKVKDNGTMFDYNLLDNNNEYYKFEVSKNNLYNYNIVYYYESEGN